MADFSKPTVTQVYTEVFTDIRENQEELAKMFSGSVPSNTPTGAVRFLNGTFSTYNGSSFVDTPIAIAGGGTGATTPSAVRSNFDLLSSSEISAQFVSGQAGTGSGEFRNNGQNDNRFVQGQAGTGTTQFRNNSQNDGRFVQGQAGTADSQVQTNAQNRNEFAIISGENNSDFYQTMDIDIDNDIPSGSSGQFTSGDVYVTRIGRMVTIAAKMSHALAGVVISDPGLIPSWARPFMSMENCYSDNLGKLFTVKIGSDGKVTTYYRNLSTGNIADQTETGAISITYTI